MATIHGPLSLPLLFLTLILLTIHPSSASSSSHCTVPPDSANTLQILHALGPCSPLRPSAPPPPSWEDYLPSSDQSRLAYLSSLATAKHSFVPIASGSKILQTPTYVVRANIGTPPQPMLVAIDISNDAAWIPSKSCVGCPQMSAVFNLIRSSTFKPVPCGSPQCSMVPNPSCPPKRAPSSCSFNFTYGSSSISASLSQDSISLASDIVKGYTFGLIDHSTGTSTPPQGLLGLGRGPLSFLSQTKDLYGSTFSYCLPNFRSLNFSGTLRLGPSGQPIRIKTTPLLFNPRRSSLYYVNLQRIRVGRKYVVFPPSALAFNPSTGAGTILDSGTMFTRLVAPVYNAVRDEFRRRVNKPITTLGGFDTCYSGPIVAPTISFEFPGMNMTLPMENLMIHSSSGDISCLAMAAAPENVNSVLNVIANMQQQNHRVLFDVSKGRVGIAREPCTSP